MAIACQRLRQMNDGDLTRQLWVIRAWLATLSWSEGPTTRRAFRSVGPQKSTRADSFLAAARAIGDRLESLALRDESDAMWVGPVAPAGEGFWSLLPLALEPPLCDQGLTWRHSPFDGVMNAVGSAS